MEEKIFSAVSTFGGVIKFICNAIKKSFLRFTLGIRSLKDFFEFLSNRRVIEELLMIGFL